MTKDVKEDVEKTRDKLGDKLVQTKLTSAFTSNRIHPQSSTSPYFTKPTQGNHQSSKPAVDLYPFRRAPPKTQKAPSLCTSTSSSLLAQVASETKSLLPGILLTTPHAPANGQLYKKADLPPLSPEACPHALSTPFRVLNADSIDVALELTRRGRSDHGAGSEEKPVLILNMANAFHSGGGWLGGALAQEEALCYRSSLAFTLKNRFYPIPDNGGLYSPTVVVMRDNMASGHGLLDLARPEQLPVVSVVSVAAVRGPAIVKDLDKKEKYRRAEDRDLMKGKMRTILRIAARNKHRRLVLGALGCGAFGNPSGEVVECWREVFQEEEFRGGWWETVVFAVMDGGISKGLGNYGTFLEGLDGLEVSSVSHDLDGILR